MKKLLIFTHNLKTGGVQKQIKLITKYLKSYFNITILLCESSGDAVENNINILPEMKIDVDGFNSKDNAEIEEVGKDLFLFRKSSVIKAVEDIQPDLILTFEDYHNIMMLEAKKDKNWEIPVYVSTRNLPSILYSDRLIHLLSPDFYHEGISLYKFAEKVIINSDAVKTEMESYDLANVTKIRNAVDLKKIEDEEVDSLQYENFLLHVGRFDSHQKGQHDMLDAFSLLKNKAINLLFVGDGKDFSDVQQKVTDMNLDYRVYFTGFQPAIGYLKKAKALIFPSYYEGFPNTVLEAFVCKTPVISYDFLPSAKEISDYGNLMDIVERGNVEQLAACIDDFLENSIVLTIKAEKAYNSVFQFDKKSVGAHWYEVLSMNMR